MLFNISKRKEEVFADGNVMLFKKGNMLSVVENGETIISKMKVEEGTYNLSYDNGNICVSLAKKPRNMKKIPFWEIGIKSSDINVTNIDGAFVTVDAMKSMIAGKSSILINGKTFDSSNICVIVTGVTTQPAIVFMHHGVMMDDIYKMRNMLCDKYGFDTKYTLKSI